MLDQAGFAALSHIYDASVNTGRWRHALDAVADAVEAKAIALVIRQPDGEAKEQTLLSSVYHGLRRSPWGVYYGLRYKHLQKPDWEFLSRQPAHEPTPDTALGAPPDELDARGDYAFLRRKLNVGRRLGVRLNDDKVWFDAMSIGFDAKRPGIPDAATLRTLPLLPHLTKAVEISRVFIELRNRYRAVLTALDRVQVGMMIAVPSGEIIVANAEAERICDLEDGIGIDRSNLPFLDDPDQTARLRSFVRTAVSTAEGEAETAEQFMIVDRRSAQTPLLLDVTPLRDSAAELDGPLAGALITVIDADRVPHLHIDRFARLYGLSTAEAEVCALIANGKTNEEIAEFRSTTPVTAKNQVASILAKTATSRRVDLIRLIVRVLPPVG